jgi:hypothetical protein
MSIRTISGAAVALALIALPAGASARPDGPIDNPPPLAGGAPSVQPVAATPADPSTGTSTAAVLAIAGGTLLVGAAGGFGGARAVTRRQALDG